MLFGLVFMSSYGISLVYATRERQLMKNFVAQKVLKPGWYLLTMMIRSAFFGICQSFLWVFISLPLMDLFGSTIDVVFVNTAVFAATWTGSTFALATIVPPAFVAHNVMLLDVYGIFLSGLFSLWSQSYRFTRGLQYLNPLFYMVSANSGLLVMEYDSGCGKRSHPGLCATPRHILDTNEIQAFSALEAQGFCLAFGLIFFTLALIRNRPKTEGGCFGRGKYSKGVIRTVFGEEEWGTEQSTPVIINSDHHRNSVEDSSTTNPSSRDTSKMGFAHDDDRSTPPIPPKKCFRKASCGLEGSNPDLEYGSSTSMGLKLSP